MRVLLLGGRGFVGRHAARALRARGHHVVIGSRRAGCGREAHLERLTRPADWDSLLRGVEVAVNAVGILRERGRETYERVHHLAPAALAAACAQRGLRLVHVSALGLHAEARSRFIRSKLSGEHAIAANGRDYCIVRPSLLDGAGGFGARWLRALSRLPVHLVPAEANGLIAALDVEDLGEAIAVLCEAPSVPSEVELGGAAAWTIGQYLQAHRAALGLPPALQLRVPGWLARIGSHLCDVLHFSPFSFGHLELLRRNNLPSPNRLAQLVGHPGAMRALARGGAPIVDRGLTPIR
jgi:NADH dehydrogenase